MPDTNAAAARPEPDRLERLVRQVAGPRIPFRAVQMPGGASTRRFFRVDIGDGRTAVAIFVPDAGKPDEIVKTSERNRRWPFLEVRDLLAERGIRVPRLLAEACDDGLVLVEDLGDDTLANYLERAPHRREALYQLAVADLARAQALLEELPPSSIVCQRTFDEDLLRWELEHFREWGLEARGIQLGPADRDLYEESAGYLASEIASWPRSFVHRDYQSRNLMVRGGSSGDPAHEELVWLDFQDALLGPRVYDLVALLGDSYQTFDVAFIHRRIDEYASHRGLDERGRAAIAREFDLVMVQRKLKDAGRFVYIDRVKNNPHFLPFVEPTIAKARGALRRLADDPQLAGLAALLERVLGPAE